MTRRWLLWFVGSCLPLVGCAGEEKRRAPELPTSALPSAAAPAPAPAPAAPPPASTESLEAAEAELAAALRELDGALASAEPAAEARSAPADADRSPPAKASRGAGVGRAEKGADAPAGEAPKAAAAAQNRDDRYERCITACKAFGSLQRAKDAVCRLDAQPPAARCARAESIVREAQARVASCSCRE
jgi:hypothetical protein